MLFLPVNLGIGFLSYVWVFSAVGSRKKCGLESLHFRVPVNKCKCFLGQIFLYPYATKMGAVVTRMLITFCVSVCYKNGCCGYTDVNILRVRMLQKWVLWLHGCLHFAYPYATKMGAVVTRMLTFCVSVCYKNGCCGYTDVNILRVHMLQKWVLWLHGC